MVEGEKQKDLFWVLGMRERGGGVLISFLFVFVQV